MPDEEEQRPRTISRRTTLKGVAAGTAIAWTAPILMSIESKAAAASNPVSEFICGTPGSCDNFASCGDPSLECVCAGNTSFGSLCVEASTPCAGLADCNSDLTCSDGISICVVNSCCVRAVCVPPTFFCAAATGAPRRGATPGGPTIASRAA
jgi:hypothetical protein